MLLDLAGLIHIYGLQPTGVLHLGAHLGEEAAAYEACGLHDVVWVEGNPELQERLQAAVEPLGHRVIHALVSDRSGEAVRFNVTNNVQSSSLLDLGTHRLHHPEVHVTHTLELTTTTVDQLAREHDFASLNFMNLDLQGAELRALRGAKTQLENVRYIFTEVNREAVYKGCALVGELDAFLGEQDFRRVITRWTRAQWGDALYIRGGVPLQRRVRGALRRRSLRTG